ncbi:unnamed protein product [Hydatigera taeniaeformis]|uniref:Purine nucleoside phosphorylase n=1 Tax=Hydatigena taeniaeformis TaxID=6205 RepID=A0A3P7HGQ2_HYDTA|nr:unnamed protein product [Hydatigera taeniaeformis]
MRTRDFGRTSDKTPMIICQTKAAAEFRMVDAFGEVQGRVPGGVSLWSEGLELCTMGADCRVPSRHSMTIIGFGPNIGASLPNPVTFGTRCTSVLHSKHATPGVNMSSFEVAQSVADYLKDKIPFLPEVGIICGSGLGGLAELVTEATIVKYSDIKEFPESTVVGHAGNLVFGHLAGKNVVLMQGRFHPYEGYEMSKVILPIRVMSLLGVETLIVTNAAGGLNPEFKVGDMMIIKDHISLLGLTGKNPLVGPNESQFGPRFPPMKGLYTKELRELAKEIAMELEIEQFLQEGVYVAQMGPAYETPSEANFLRMIGADAVGMSTIHEAVVARHAGMKIFGMSLITNKVALDEDSEVICNHEEVLETSAKRAEIMKTFVEKLVGRLGVRMGSYVDANGAADYIKSKVRQTPQVGIICGSGLGKLAEIVSDPVVVKYSDIKQFPRSTVVGHAGNLVFGKLAGKNVVVMQGRFHPYEGYPMRQVTLPVRVMKLLGVETLIVTNAAGSLNPDYKVGDLMIIKDHISLLGMTGLNPLVGPNDERFGPRFPAMTNIYTKELREIAKAVGAEMQIEDFLREGVYVAEMGPTYETIAEARFLRMIGADAAGMSTAHEAIVAKHAGLKVFAMSLITNQIVVDEDSVVACNHEEVLQTSAKRAEVMKTFVMGMLEKM